MKHTLYLFFLSFCFFLELPFGTAQLSVQGLLHVQDDALVYVEPDLNIETESGVVENNGNDGVDNTLDENICGGYSIILWWIWLARKKTILKYQYCVAGVVGNEGVDTKHNEYVK